MFPLFLLTDRIIKRLALLAGKWNWIREKEGPRSIKYVLYNTIFSLPNRFQLSYRFFPLLFLFTFLLPFFLFRIAENWNLPQGPKFSTELATFCRTGSNKSLLILYLSFLILFLFNFFLSEDTCFLAKYQKHLRQ